MMRRSRGSVLVASMLAVLPAARAVPFEPERVDVAMRAAVEADWAGQEKRFDRSIDDPEAFRDAVRRCERLLAALARVEGVSDLDTAASRERLDALRARCADLLPSDTAGRSSLYRRIRWLTRDVALRNPLFASRSVVFLERRRFICQMLHEYLGYYYDYGDIDGGTVRQLVQPGRSMETRDLIDSRLPRGNYTTLAVSFDARTIYFAFAPRAHEKPDYYSDARRNFDIWTIDVDGADLRRLTDGPYDDFDPCPSPDGGIAFLSTRRGGFGRCHNPWEPLPAYTLHRMDADGGNVRTLSYHETNEWHPSILGDGRIVYTRWDYVDRSAANFHGLWATRPDGTDPVALFGNYTRRINACYQPRAVPGSQKIVFVAGAHHADVGGSLVLFDPSKAALDPQTGEDRFDSLEVLTPEVCFPEANGGGPWPDSWFHGPWPLSEDFYLVAFSFDPLPGMGPGVKRDTETGLYLFDRFGNLELLYRRPGVSSMYPVPLAARSAPPVLSSHADATLGDEAELILADVRQSLLPLPPNRPIRALRIFQVLPKSTSHVANRPRLGYANAESARWLLGTIPVEADGSAYFRVPARKPLYFQAVDADGKAVQGMRSVTYLQPGERRSCVGCHEPPGTVPPARETLAMQRAPSAIEPGPDGSRPWSFPRLVQPILDARCVRCHDGSGAKGTHAPDLTRRSAGELTASYKGLEPWVRWYEWGGGIGGDVTRPGRMPADESPLTKVIEDEHHAEQTGLTDAERRTLYLWLDGNAAFYGTYREAARQAQRRGEIVRSGILE